MSVIKEILKAENDYLYFGNYLAQEKQKLEDFIFNNNKYKVKTHNELTRLEKNDNMLLETIPGSAIHKFIMDDKIISFEAEGFENTQITLGLEPDQTYELKINDVLINRSKSNPFGKFSFSVTLSDKPQSIKIKKI